MKRRRCLSGAAALVLAWCAGDTTFAQKTLMANFNGVSSPPTAGIRITLSNHAQGFRASADGDLTRVGLLLYRYQETIADIEIDLYSASNSVPGTIIQNLGTIPWQNATSSYAWVEMDVSSPPTLSEGTNYFLVFSYPNGNGDYATRVQGHEVSDVTDGYAWGNLAERAGDSWTASKQVMAFRTYLAGTLDMQSSGSYGTSSWGPGGTFGRVAQAFTAPTNGTIRQLRIALYRYSTTETDITVDLYSTDPATGLPGAHIANMGIIPYADVQVDINYPLVAFDITNGPAVNAGTQYSIVLTTSQRYAFREYPNNAENIIPGYEWGGMAAEHGGTWQIHCGSLNFWVYRHLAPREMHYDQSFDYGNAVLNFGNDLSADGWTDNSVAIEYRPDAGLRYFGLREPVGGAMVYETTLTGERWADQALAGISFTDFSENDVFYVFVLGRVDKDITTSGGVAEVAFNVTGTTLANNQIAFGVNDEKKAFASVSDATGILTTFTNPVATVVGDTVGFLLEITKGTGATPTNSLVKGWFNPNLGAPGTPDFSTASRVGNEGPAHKIDQVRYRFNNITGFTWDEVRFTADYGAIYAAPPAGTMILIK